MAAKSVPKDGPVPHLTGSTFEWNIQRRLDKYRAARIADIRRSGVQATMLPGGDWQVIPSRPDFEGHFVGPVAVCFDAKVCSQASFPLDKYRESRGARKRQLEYMLEKAIYDVRCFFLIHWNERQLMTKAEESITYAFPVHPEMPFWKRFQALEVKSIRRGDCEEVGLVVPWTVFGENDHTRQPDIQVLFR